MSDVQIPWQSNELLYAFFRTSPLPMILYDRATNSFIDVNESAIQHYGYSRSEWLGLSFSDLYLPSDLPSALSAMNAEPQALFHHDGTWRHLKKDRSYIDVDVLRFLAPCGEEHAVLFMIHDVTDRQREFNRRLNEAQSDLSKTRKIAHIGSWTWDIPKDRFWARSPETYDILGFPRPPDMPDNVTADTVLQQIHPEDRAAVQHARHLAFTDPTRGYDVEYRVVHSDGRVLNIHSVGEVSFDDQGNPLRLDGIVQDITEKKYAEERIKRLAYYDEVTDLPNRVLLRQELSKALTERSEEIPPVALLAIELIGFHDVSYTLGHVNGDLLLKAVGARIRQAVGAPGMVGRLEASQFAVMLPNASTYDAIGKVRQIQAALEVPFSIAGISYELNARFGIAVAPAHGTDADTILRKADGCLYHAKQSGQCYCVYQTSNDPYNPQRLAMMGEFRKAVHNGELQLYCQPKADIQARRIIGAEALVRWQHPEYGLVSPDQFIPLIEQTDLIHLLTRFVLQASLSQCYSWRQMGVHIPLAVNLSARNLMEPNLSADLSYMLLTWGADSDWLGLEITEGSMMTDPVTSIAELSRLSAMGFRLFVDDFGTGYSSLSYLTKLPVDVIKIDHSFTMHMIRDKGAAAIVKSIIELAHNLGMRVVAEGAANQEIWDALEKLGCDEAQGYFISPPIPARDFIPWLHTSGFDFPSEGRRPMS